MGLCKRINSRRKYMYTFVLSFPVGGLKEKYEDWRFGYKNTMKLVKKTNT